MKPMNVSTKKTAEGGFEVNIYSQKQQMLFDQHTGPDTEKRKTQIIRQYSSGEIILHHFYLDEDRGWTGYVVIIGPRGGKRAVYGYTVIEDGGELTLTQ